MWRTSRRRTCSRSEYSSSALRKSSSMSTSCVPWLWSRAQPASGNSSLIHSEAYLNANYFQQAFEHLSNALKLNSTFIAKNEEAKEYHTHILTLLGRCYMEGGNIDDALELLEKSLHMNKSILGEDDYSNCSILTIIAQVYLKKKMYEEAIQQLTTVWEMSEAKFGLESEQSAAALVELANVYDNKGNYKDATEYQKKALDVYKKLGSVDSKVLGATGMKLAELHEHAEELEEAVSILREVLCA
eukprot:TRINITY_DN1742_c0_g1_i5.p1 TRINITY_DN1742_c0_g1~~TRINITY_DN1742_c0_g1_i5.p1  ORF type:complete len:244 (+),score=60.51 TRINITY_DN1742_c0_g1_i5:259-990(+)